MSAGLAGLRADYQPVVDLRDRSVVGYEALARGDAAGLQSPAELFAAARAGALAAELDAACRALALEGAVQAGLGAPFALFLNVSAEGLAAVGPASLVQGDDAPAGGPTFVLEVDERALVARPERLLRALTDLRTRGWGVALDDVSADPKALALMSVIQPDIIKLDLHRLAERPAAEVAATVAAVGAESERRHATVLAEGIDSEDQLDAARAYGATLGQGYLLGAPGPLPSPLPGAGRPIALAGSGAAPDGPGPYERIVNWRRPALAGRPLAAHAARLVLELANDMGESGVLLATFPRPELADLGALRQLARRLAFVGALSPGPPEPSPEGVRGGAPVPDGTWTVLALGPTRAACFAGREAEDGCWSFATTYDRELVVECALGLLARMAPL